MMLPVSFGTSNGAFKEALENAQTDTLVNGRLRQTVAGFIPPYYQFCLVVEGQPGSAAVLGPGVTVSVAAPAPTAAPASAAAPAPGGGLMRRAGHLTRRRKHRPANVNATR
jgi:hypothetical protein